MGPSTLMLEELVTRMAREVDSGGEQARMEPLVDPLSGQWIGLVIVSLLERIGVYWHTQDPLSFTDINKLRRSMEKGRVDRAYLYIPMGAPLASAVGLFASLSKIRIVRSRAIH